MKRIQIAKTVSILGLVAIAWSLSAQRPAPAPIPNMDGKILTVTGPIDPSELGVTLMHEHIFIDFQSPVPRAPNRATDMNQSAQPITMENLYLARTGRGVSTNGFLGDFDTSLAEVTQFKE